MSEFIQLHFLTAYPPANLNRDDLGRPKTAMLGGSTRLRVSSQCLKRTWRTSDVFRGTLNDALGSRTTRVGEDTYAKLLEAKVPEDKARAVAVEVATRFGKVDAPAAGEEKPKARGKKKDAAAAPAADVPATAGDARDTKDLRTKQLAHVTPHEWHLIGALVKKVAGGHTPTKDDYDALLSNGHGAVDVALFGRMLADASSKNVEAAAQVAHAISVHKVAVEDDFFTAVDDLKTREEDLGAGHMGNSEFAAGVLYHYVCINKTQFLGSLDNNTDLANKALRALVEASVTTSPSGKRNAFGSSARASFLLVEKGPQQPRSLVSAFLAQPRGDDNVLVAAINALTTTRDNMDKVYGKCADASESFNAVKGEGSLAGVLDFVAPAPKGA